MPRLITYPVQQLLPFVDARPAAHQVADFLRLLASEVVRGNVSALTVSWGGRQFYDAQVLLDDGDFHHLSFETRKRNIVEHTEVGHEQLFLFPIAARLGERPQ